MSVCRVCMAGSVRVALGLVLVAAGTVWPSRALAGGGPQNVAVVVNAKSWASKAVATDKAIEDTLPSSAWESFSSGVVMREILYRQDGIRDPPHEWS